jgi:predicted AAA+ superfamily ATPase
MLNRTIHSIVAQRLREYPAVAILGPRQCGKTTLAKTFASRYFDLEQEADQLRLDIEWESIAQSSELIILDEAQEAPEVFARLRGAIDEDRKRNGRFLLSGSVSPSLTKQVSESLAGRIALVELSPLALSEIDSRHENRLWLTGGYPDGGILKPSAFGNWQRNYLELLAQRDLPRWGLPARPMVTLRLMKMLAALHGNLWNASQLASSMGLDAKTINSYLDFLEGAYLIRRLPPYYTNIKKRLVKSPKTYWRDTGLLHALLNISTIEQLQNQPWVGTSWEGFVIEQIERELNARGIAHTLYHFRTSDQYEIDLVIDFGAELWSLEIKLTTNPSSNDYNRLCKTSDLIGASKRFLISKASKPSLSKQGGMCALKDFLELLRERR